MADADSLVRVFHMNPRGGTEEPSSGLDFLDMQSQNRSFSGMAGVDATDLSLTGPGGDPERPQGAEVTAGFFQVLGVQPLLGRGFVADEDPLGRSRVVVLGHTLWKRRYGGDPGIVGRTITVNGEPHTVVGAAGAGGGSRTGASTGSAAGTEYTSGRQLSAPDGPAAPLRRRCVRVCTTRTVAHRMPCG